MAIAHDQPPQNPTTPDKQDDSGGAPTITDSFSTIFPIVLGGAFIIGLSLAFLVLWLNRRRHRRNRANSPTSPNPNQKDNEAILIDCDASRSSHDTNGGAGAGGKSSWLGSTTRRKLQKACSVGGANPGVWSKVGVCGGEIDDGEGRGWPRRHMSAPLIPWPCSKGHFHFGLGPRSESCRWPGEEVVGTEMGEVIATGGVCKGKKSWIDEDALHGPRVSSKEKGDGSGLGWRRKKKRREERDSWPLRNRAPTLPRVYHTVHGYPYLMSGAGGGESSEALLGKGSEPTPATGMDDARPRAFSRVLPEVPKPALVANRDRRVVRPSVTMGYVYGASRIPMPIISPPASPTRSAPTTPFRHRGRQRSTDSTLSDILKSTEQRLREGSVSGAVGSRKATASPTRTSAAKVLGPRGFEASGSRSRTPSPKKIVSGQSSTAGHQRQDSQQSGSSGADSLVGDECPNPDIPSGLTSPSRNQEKPEAERRPLQAQSVRTSLSSELSTLYSEDEMPEEVKRAIMPLEDLIVQPQQAAKVQPPSMNDPFVTSPPALSVSRSSSVGDWPAKQSKSQDLLRLSVQRSQRLRSTTLGNARAQSQGLILAPGPLIQAPKPSATMPVPPPSIQPDIALSASEPPPMPARPSSTSSNPSGPLFLRVTKTSTLSTMPQLPPPAAPGFESLKEARSGPASPTKTPSDQQQQQQPTRRSPVLMLPSTERSPAPPSQTRRVGGELRLSLILPPKQLQDAHNQNRNSASSSLYSQDTSPHPRTSPLPNSAIELNRAGFAANSSLYPAPLSPLSRRPVLSSKLSSELIEVNDNNKEGGNENDEKNQPSEIENEADGDDGNDNNDGENTPLALTSTIASLRRMNSGVSTLSSLRSIADRDDPASRDLSPNPSPERGVPGPAARDVSFPPSEAGSGSAGGDEAATCTVAEGAGANIGGREGLGLRLSLSSGQRDGQQHRKSIGARNYYILGNGDRRQSRRLSRVASAGSGIVKSPSGGGVGVGAAGAGTGVSGGSPLKRRRPGSVHHHWTASTPLLKKSASEVAVGGDEGKENKAGDGRFKVEAGEFTFEVSNPNVSGKGPLGLREGSSGSVNALVMPQNDSQRLSLAWKPAEGAVSRNGSPVRLGGVSSRASMRSVDSLGLYDPQGFLISASPVRRPSPSGLRV